MSQYLTVRINTNILKMFVVAVGAFMLALPVGAALFPRDNGVVNAHDAPTATAPHTNAVTSATTQTSGCVDPTATAAKGSAATSAVETIHSMAAPTHKHHGGHGTVVHKTVTHTTNTSTNNGGSNTSVGDDGIAVGVGTGDILSDNNLSVPVLSNNNTNVAPVTNVNPNLNLLNNNNDLLDLTTVLGIL